MIGVRECSERQPQTIYDLCKGVFTGVLMKACVSQCIGYLGVCQNDVQAEHLQAELETHVRNQLKVTVQRATIVVASSSARHGVERATCNISFSHFSLPAQVEFQPIT